METEVSKSRFKARALEIFRRIERTGEPVIITDHGAPTLVIQRYTRTGKSAQSRLKGSVVQFDDPLAPVAEDDWETLA